MNRLQDVNRNKQKRESERKWEAGQLSDAADYAMRPNMQRRYATRNAQYAMRYQRSAPTSPRIAVTTSQTVSEYRFPATIIAWMFLNNLCCAQIVDRSMI